VPLFFASVSYAFQSCSEVFNIFEQVGLKLFQICGFVVDFCHKKPKFDQYAEENSENTPHNRKNEAKSGRYRTDTPA